MFLLKSKKLFQSLHTYFNNKLISLYSLSIAAPLLCGVLVFGLVVALPQTQKPTQVHSTQSSNYKKSSSKDNQTQHTEISSPAATVPSVKTATVTPSSPVTTTHATVTVPASLASTAPVEPVVTPSPSSSVSGLTPTTSTPTPAPGSQTSTSAPTTTPAVTTSYSSSNWSGYIATTSSYTGISGSWTATNATGNGRTTSADATWIGIGGVTSADLIQVGTDNIVSASGQVTTSAFYELLPASSQPIPSINVSPGDSISASLLEVSSGQWTITITDETDSETYTVNVSYSSSLSSAEWIEEDPSYSFRQQIPFDNFQEATFTNDSTTVGGLTDNITTSDAQPVIMVNRNDQTIALPSSVSTDGSSFTVSP